MLTKYWHKKMSPILTAAYIYILGVLSAVVYMTLMHCSFEAETKQKIVGFAAGFFVTSWFLLSLSCCGGSYGYASGIVVV
jgi:hypothetical protein